MKQLILLICIGLVGHSHAEIADDLYIDYAIKSNSLDSSLENNQSKFTFEFVPLDGSSTQMIYSIDGAQYTGNLKDHSLEILTTPGKHIFQFYYTEKYAEIYTDSLDIANRFHAVYEVRMTFSIDIRYSVDKPVIYLYPEKEMDVELTLDIQGKPTFYYPSYESAWKFKASPSGDLAFGEKTYDYLFWESEQSGILTKDDLKTGFNVEKENVISFLEEKLTIAGLNSKEKADFITFWGPQLAKNELNFVHFEFNEACNRYAEIAITPKPTELYRIYMSWMPISELMNVEEQPMQIFKREGFTVLEWGGMEISAPNTSVTALNQLSRDK